MTATPRHRRAFSLIEVLMAIFILGVGAISIAALFPAGIVQQRQATDAVMGPIVAASAIDVLRSKLSPADFASFEDFSPAPDDIMLPPLATNVDGDWSWVRPGVIFGRPFAGALDIFSYDRLVDDDRSGAWEFSPPNYSGNGWLTVNGSAGVPTLYGIPFAGDSDPFTNGRQPPRVVILQDERYYPQQYGSRPQYVWDCMFRRHYGRVQVAIFVYRVNEPGGEPAPYVLARESSDRRNQIPMPVSLQAPTPIESWDAGGFDGIEGTADDFLVPIWGYDECNEDIDPTQRDQAWAYSGQWLMDQNSNVHRVVGAFCGDYDNDGTDEPVAELTQSPPWLAPVPGSYSAGVDGWANVVTNIWYVPLQDSEGRTLTPVYVTVKEL